MLTTNYNKSKLAVNSRMPDWPLIQQCGKSDTFKDYFPSMKKYDLK